jgi:hypothetical protein
MAKDRKKRPDRPLLIQKKYTIAVKAMQIALQRLEEIQYQKASPETIQYLKEVFEVLGVPEKFTKGERYE